MKCESGLEVKVLMSATGYYIGTEFEGRPSCRFSNYFDNRREAEELLLETDREELDCFCRRDESCGLLFNYEGYNADYDEIDVDEFDDDCEITLFCYDAPYETSNDWDALEKSLREFI